jgi:hypothetical protein
VRGLRAVRRRPELLAAQLDAIAQAAARSPAEVWVMAPMVATSEEAAWFRAQLHDRPVAKTGVMIEIPAAALTAQAILAEADFASLGTNDLAHTRSRPTAWSGHSQACRALAACPPQRQETSKRQAQRACPPAELLTDGVHQHENRGERNRMRVLLIGPPAQARAPRRPESPPTSISPRSTGDLLREEVAAGTQLGRTAKAYVDNGDPVPDDLVITITKARFVKANTEGGYILDDYPRTLAQAEAAHRWATARGVPFER